MGDKRLLKPRRRRQLRQVTQTLGFCLVVYCVLFIFNFPVPSYFPRSGDTPWPGYSSLSSSTRRLSNETLNNLSLTQEECRATFPGLTHQIDEVVAQGPFKVKHTGDFGPLQGRIKDGQISILHAQRKSDLSREMVNSRTASLHQLHRALITSREPVPDTVFTLNFQDQPFGSAWTYSRQADPSLRPKDPNARSFPMPHFSFWAWDLPFIGSMSRAARAIDAFESPSSSSSPLGSGWTSKIPKAVWRGTTWFNSVQSPQLRGKLIQAARDKPWADVQALEWKTEPPAKTTGGRQRPSSSSSSGGGGGGGGSGAANKMSRTATNALPIEGFCRYRYVIHTEGVTYSGRFQFLQMCASVVLTPPIQWLQHTSHLVRPLFSSSILAAHDSKATTSPARSGKSRAGGRWTPSPRVLRTWPTQYPPDQANIVFVAPDWSDLEDTIAWLEAHPDVAEGIAIRQRELFSGGGYFSPAAEACYWRALVRGWASVAVVDREDREGGAGDGEKHWADEEGVAYEAWSLTNGD